MSLSLLLMLHLKQPRSIYQAAKLDAAIRINYFVNDAFYLMWTKCIRLLCASKDHMAKDFFCIFKYFRNSTTLCALNVWTNLFTTVNF